MRAANSVCGCCGVYFIPKVGDYKIPEAHYCGAFLTTEKPFEKREGSVDEEFELPDGTKLYMQFSTTYGPGSTGIGYFGSKKELNGPWPDEVLEFRFLRYLNRSDVPGKLHAFVQVQYDDDWWFSTAKTYGLGVGRSREERIAVAKASILDLSKDKISTIKSGLVYQSPPFFNRCHPERNYPSLTFFIVDPTKLEFK